MRSSVVAAAGGAAVVLTVLVGPVAAAPGAWAATSPQLPSHAAVVEAGKRALDYYRPTYATTTLTPRNGWSWGTYFEGVHAFYRHSGDARYLADGTDWGRSNAWGLSTTEIDPDSIKAGQVYHALNQVDPAASLAAMDERMAADLTGLPLSRYDWIDALFMGLADWALWSVRTGDEAYLSKLDALFLWTRDSGATSARCAGRVLPQQGLYDAAAGLWYRDCTFVGARDVNGKPVFWSRGNGWVIAGMADVLRSLPAAASARATKYEDMLRTMAGSLAAQQGADGLWRSSLLDSALYPQPETSGTALITYALAYGIRTGVLDPATYLPVVARAWQGLAGAALQPSGFLSGCQGPGIGPAAPYTGLAPRTAPTATSSGTVNADSSPYCVGAFLMAAAEVAQLVPDLALGRPVSATAQETGNGSGRLVDGDVTTRWSAPGFPQSATVDLGSPRVIGSAMVVPYLDRAYKYRLRASSDGQTWTTLVDRSTNTLPGSRPDDFPPVTARFVRLDVIGVTADPTSWVSVQELGVYPPLSAGATPLASDSFSRTVATGLGSADNGGAWTVSGASSGYSVSGGVGRLRMGSPGVGKAALLPTVSVRDVVLTADAAVDKPATGGGVYLTVTARRVATSEYRATARILAGGSVSLSLRRVVAGVETVLASRTVTGLVVGAADTLRIRLSVVGSGPSTLSARVWKVGSGEPTTWQVSATDSASPLQGAGSVGVASYLSGSATNAPVTAMFDNVLAAPPG